MILALSPLGAGTKNRLFALVALGDGGNKSVIPSLISLVTDGIFSTSLSPGTGVISAAVVPGPGLSGLVPNPGLRETDSITATLA